MKRILIIGGVVTLSLSVGSVAGYLFAKRQLETEYAERTEREIAEAKEFYRRAHKQDGFETPAAAVESLLLNEAADAMETYTTDDDADMPPEDYVAETETAVHEVKTIQRSDYVGEVVTKNVFNNIGIEKLGVENRTSDKPYVISLGEYMDNEWRHEQTNFTWYEGDFVLADSVDENVEDVDGTVGRFNLKCFGIGSEDPNNVLIRNEKLKMDFEVLRSTGKYKVEVLGLDDE